MANSIPDFPETVIKEAFLEIEVKQKVLSVTKDKLDDQSKEIMKLEQELQVVRQQLEIAHQQIDILQETSEKLATSNLEMSVHDKVEFEAKQHETVALRQKNLEIQMENMKLKRQMEEIQTQNSDLQLSSSKSNGKLAEITSTIESVQKEIEKLTADHKEVKEKSEIIQEQNKFVKIDIEYHKKKSADLSLKNEKLQERIGFLTNELKEKKTFLAIGIEKQIMNDFQSLQNCLKLTEEKLSQESENNAKLRSTLTEEIQCSKNALLARKEIEVCMMELQKAVETTFNPLKRKQGDMDNEQVICKNEKN